MDIKVFFEKDHDYKLVLQDSKFTTVLSEQHYSYLRGSLDLLELYQSLIESYLSFEESLYSSLIRNKGWLKPTLDFTYADNSKLRIESNVNLTSFFNLFKLLVDQIKFDKTLFTSPASKDLVQELREKADKADTYISLAIDARNYLQHKQLLVNEINYKSSSDFSSKTLHKSLSLSFKRNNLKSIRKYSPDPQNTTKSKIKKSENDWKILTNTFGDKIDVHELIIKSLDELSSVVKELIIGLELKVKESVEYFALLEKVVEHKLSELQVTKGDVLEYSWLDSTNTNRYLNLVWFTEPYSNLISDLRFNFTHEKLRYSLRAWK